MYITEEKDFHQLVDNLKSCDTLLIDTEFVRERTYFHRLGLIQVAGNGICAAVDPIAIKKLDPLLEIISDPKVLKVFHAGKQDIEILFRLCGDIIYPVFDTQVAASMVGWGAQISFAKLVRKVTGKMISKAETYSDWCRRPISESQIEYALNDVRYLVPVYEKLVKTLKKADRLEWLEEELDKLTDRKNYELPDPRRQFLKVKNARTLKPKSMGVLLELAAWRENEGLKRDCLPRFIIRDETLLALAQSMPKKPEDLERIRGLHSKERAGNGEQILQAIQRGLKIPADQIPPIPEPQRAQTLLGVEELLAAYIQIRSEELKIEPHVLSDRRQIHEFVRQFQQNGNLDEHPLLKGWRRELIGSDLLSILEGRVGLAIHKNGKAYLIPASSNGA